jgi:hypothetical protein
VPGHITQFDGRPPELNSTLYVQVLLWVRFPYGHVAFFVDLCVAGSTVSPLYRPHKGFCYTIAIIEHANPSDRAIFTLFPIFARIEQNLRLLIFLNVLLLMSGCLKEDGTMIR